MSHTRTLAVIALLAAFFALPRFVPAQDKAEVELRAAMELESIRLLFYNGMCQVIGDHHLPAKRKTAHSYLSPVEELASPPHAAPSTRGGSEGRCPHIACEESKRSIS